MAGGGGDFHAHPPGLAQHHKHSVLRAESRLPSRSQVDGRDMAPLGSEDGLCSLGMTEASLEVCSLGVL